MKNPLSWRRLAAALSQCPGSPADDDVVARKRKLSRESSERHRERRKFYGHDYRVTPRVTPPDVLEILSARYPAVAHAMGCSDKELGRILDALEAAVAYGELGAFENDPGDYA
jgi:hypothetical protein